MGLDPKEPFPKRPRLKYFNYVGTYAYFVTILTKDYATYFKEAEVVDGAIDILNGTAGSEKFNVLIYCFMPDHLHLLIQGIDDNSNLRKFIGLFK
jgi:putative transposase